MIRKISLFLLLLAWPVFAQEEAENYVVLENAGKKESFLQIMVADTPEEREKGLMFYRFLPLGNSGMIFVFDEVGEVAMWMKNTHLSLDMLFIDADGKVVAIAENTRPMSLDHIKSGQPVKYVLELEAGTTNELDIKVGDRMKAFKHENKLLQFKQE